MNEAFWKLDGSTLVFLRVDGEPTTRFKRIAANRREGPHLGTAQVPANGIVPSLTR